MGVILKLCHRAGQGRLGKGMVGKSVLPTVVNPFVDQ